MTDNEHVDKATNESEPNPKVSDPFGVIEDSSFPRSYKEYRIVDSFSVFAQSEEQALQRWQFFKDVLSQLFANEWHPHDLVKFVVPESMNKPGNKPTCEFVAEEWIEKPDDLHGGMASSLFPEWAWLDPNHDAGWNAGVLADQIMQGQSEQDDEDMYS